MDAMRASLLVGMVMAAMVSFGAAEVPETPDPSGTWRSPIGELSLLLSGDALSFSYAAVFGETAHICDGAGVAGLVTGNRYEYIDEQGTITLFLTAGEVRVQVTDGIASFCGAGWGGDVLVRQGPPQLPTCWVRVERSFFHVVGASPPLRRKGYVIRDDRVEVVPLQSEGSQDWVLARFRGPRGATVGLLRKADLDCGEAPKP